MKKMKKLCMILLAVIMAATSIAGCGNSKEAKSDSVIKLDVYSQLANYSGIQGGWFGQLLKDKFNVELNITKENAGATFSTRMEQGNLGDIVIFGSTADQYQQAIKKGMLLDWNKDNILTQFGPYVKEHMANALKHNADISGGTTYGFGANVATNPKDHEQFMYSWDLRFDLYKQLGYPEIKNLDDLFNVFKKMKELSPTDASGKENYAASIWPDWDKNVVMYIKSTATAYYGYDEMGIGLYNCDNGEFYDVLQKDGPYVEMLKFFNKLYRNDLLDPDSQTQTLNDVSAKVQNGRVFWSIFNYAGSSQFNTPANIKQNKAMYSVCPTEAKPIVYGMNVMGTNRVWTIGSKTAYPDVCMKIINYLSTPEGYLNLNYGPKGLCWDYDKDGKTYFTDLGKKCVNDGNTKLTSDDSKFKEYCKGTYKDGQPQVANSTWSIDATNPESGEKYNYKYWASQSVEPAAGSIEADWRKWSKASATDEYMDNRKHATVAKASAYAEGEKSADLEVTWKQVVESIKTGSWKAIYAKDDAEFDKIIDNTINEASSYDNGKGYKECVDWCKAEAAKRKAAEDAVTEK